MHPLLRDSSYIAWCVSTASRDLSSLTETNGRCPNFRHLLVSLSTSRAPWRVTDILMQTDKPSAPIRTKRKSCEWPLLKARAGVWPWIMSRWPLTTQSLLRMLSPRTPSPWVTTLVFDQTFEPESFDVNALSEPLDAFVSHIPDTRNVVPAALQTVKLQQSTWSNACYNAVSLT